MSSELCSSKITLYKLPANEFAILANESIEKDQFIQLLLNLIDTVEKHIFTISKYKFSIRIIAGASMQKNYFIHAEMAKNHAKSSNKNFVLFEDNLYIQMYV